MRLPFALVPALLIAALVAGHVGSAPPRTRNADDEKATPSQVAIAWVLARRGPQVIPIVGVRTAEQLADNLGARKVALSAEQIERLDAIGAPALGFPRSFLESDNVRSLIYGNTWALIDR